MTLSAAASGLTTTALLVLARVVGMVLVAPVFSSHTVPLMVRAGLAIALALVLTPGLGVVHPGGIVELGLATVVQLAIGVLMGMVLAVFLAVFGLAGEVVTYQLGVGLAAQANPSLLAAGSFLSEWQTLLGIFVYVVAGGPELSVTALHASFQAIPLSAMVIPGPALGFVVGLMQTALMVALLMAMPMVTAGFIVNISVGVISRAFPQINAYFLALPINFGVSLLVFLALLPILLSVIPNFWNMGWRDLSHLLVLLEGKP